MLSELRRFLAVLCIGLLAFLHGDAAHGHGLALTLQQFGKDDPAAVVGDQLITVGDLITLTGMRSARYRPYISLTYGLDDLFMQARHAPIYRALAEEAETSGHHLSPDDDEWLETETSAFARRLIYYREVTSNLTNPTMAMLRELYEEVKDDRLRTPERFLIRRVSIPVSNEEEAQAARELLERIRAEFSEGQDIMRLLREHRLESPTRIFYPDQVEGTELADALRGVGDEEALPIRSEATAVELTIRHLHIPQGSVPLGSSLDLLTSMLMDREASRLASEFIARVAEEPRLLHFVVENLQSRGELALDSDVILLVGDVPVRRHELRAAMGWRLEIAASGDPEEFRHLALTSGVVQELLLDHVARVSNLAEDPAVVSYRANLRDTLLARKLLDKQAIARVAPATDEEALLHWRRKEAALGRFHGRVRFDQVTIPASTADIDQWSARFTQVRSVSDFNQVARDAMTRRAASLMMNGLQEHIDDLPNAARDAVDSGRLPALVIPDRNEDEPLTIYWVVEGIPDKRPAAEELEQAREQVNQGRHQDAIEDILDEMAADIQIERRIPSTF